MRRSAIAPYVAMASLTFLVLTIGYIFYCIPLKSDEDKLRILAAPIAISFVIGIIANYAFALSK
jgi:hypothetical protein